jgi:hypothetical protein
MKRREFVEKGGGGFLSLVLAYFGLTSCKKKTETSAAETTPPPAAATEAQLPTDRKDMVKKLLIEKMGKSEEEATAMVAGYEENLPQIEPLCICKKCPTYGSGETEEAFCHALVGRSDVITGEKGCDCPKCPVYKDMAMNNGYYCTRGAELEQEASKA